MSNFVKKIRDNQDKEKIKQLTGKTPKHRCPECHRFTLWINDEKGKHRCLMCEILEKENKENERAKEKTNN